MVSPTLKMQRQSEVLAVDLHRNTNRYSRSVAPGTFHRRTLLKDAPITANEFREDGEALLYENASDKWP